MRTIHVPAWPGDHVPDHDTFTAMSNMLALCLRIRREGIEPHWTNLGRHASWLLPDLHEIVRIRSGNMNTYRQTITASHPEEAMIARLIIDDCTIAECQEPDIGQCIDDVIIARRALEGVPRGPRDALVDRVDAASIELIRTIVQNDDRAPGASFSADHWPATPWRDARTVLSDFHPPERSGSETSDFPMVIGVAVDEPYGIPRRISVRLSPYHMDHTIPTTVDPMTRLRGAQALVELRKDVTS